MDKERDIDNYIVQLAESMRESALNLPEELKCYRMLSDLSTDKPNPFQL